MSPDLFYFLVGLWALSLPVGWAIGSAKGRGPEGLLFGLSLGVLGVLIIAIIGPEGPANDGSDQRLVLRDQRRRDRYLGLMTGFAGVSALALVALLSLGVGVVSVAPRTGAAGAAEHFEFASTWIGSDRSVLDAAGRSGYQIATCRWAHNGKDEPEREWGYECLMQRRTPE